ncbi:EF-P beta-lysylation protein EpmB [Alteromonadaceae bacterium BrNp21-10]|nr:EF-P beta-lysylation protein EpmB [Alteromonadaceae bacterium BrNp21-10]
MAQIIPKFVGSVERHWQKELADCVTDPEELLKLVQLEPAFHTRDIAARRLFPMRVPRPFINRMQLGNVLDPLLLQVFTQHQEFNVVADFSEDPLEEQQSSTPGLIQKYQSRVLLIVRGGCAVNCRYCFRRHFPYGENSVNKLGWQKTLQHIADDPEINEVIYSGGDPLMAKDDFLAWLTSEIEKIPHVRRIRIHSRLPVVIPSRINDELLAWFSGSRLKPAMVLHINHANEIDSEVQAAVAKLINAGVTVLNQSVLLHQVNDTVEAQVELSERLYDCGILPYYLHMLDKVQGAAHFAVDDDQARVIMAGMIKRLPGFLVPKLVREIGGQPGKTPVDLHLHP